MTDASFRSAPDFRRSLPGIGAALLAAVMLFGMFALDGDTVSKIDFSDEGYLWYGTRALKAGQAPIRDFQAYDPGRYLWSAAWSVPLGDSLYALRFGCVLFAWAGVTAGLLAVQRISRQWWFLMTVGAALSLWMFPRYKVFEQSIALMGIYVAVRLLEQPSLRRHFWSGIFVGVAAFFGRNHGLYLSIAFFLVIALLCAGHGKDALRRYFAWGSGILVGYLPQLLLLLFVPGYFRAYVEVLRQDVTLGTNVPLPIPWPWDLPEWLYSDAAWDYVAEGIFYVALPVFLLAAAIRVLRSMRSAASRYPVLVAAGCVTLPYLHYTYSRADTVHLAHSAPPLIVGIVALCHGAKLKPWRWLPQVAAVLLLATTLPPALFHAGVYALAVRPPEAFVTRELAGHPMRMETKAAAIFDAAARVATELARPEERVIFAPHFPGLYPATGRFSPVWPIYFIRKPPEAEEIATVEQMRERDVRWVMLQDVHLDGREELRFRHTHARIHAALEREFEMVPLDGLPKDIVVFRRRE